MFVGKFQPKPSSVELNISPNVLYPEEHGLLHPWIIEMSFYRIAPTLSGKSRVAE
jgi:hypothetical protein